jgi:hypothetical protein
MAAACGGVATSLPDGLTTAASGGASTRWTGTTFRLVVSTWEEFVSMTIELPLATVLLLTPTA